MSFWNGLGIGAGSIGLGSIWGIPGSVVGGITGNNLINDSGINGDATGDQMAQSGRENYANAPYTGMPAYPGYNPVYNPNTMSVGNTPNDTSGLQAFKAQALRTGPSAWAGMAEAKSNADQAAAIDQAQKQGAGATATAEGNLAMQGGLRSGAAERIQSAANKNAMDTSQNIATQGMANRSQIGINDEQNRITQLGMLPQMQQNQAEFQRQGQEFDINNMLKENQNYNAYNLGLYNTNMGGWAAGKQANATMKSGQGGSWLCTMAAKKRNRAYNKFEKSQLDKLLKFCIKKDKAQAKFYVYNCHELLKRMNKDESFDWKKLVEKIEWLIQLVGIGRIEAAYNEYVSMTKELIDKYWSECKDISYLKLKAEE